ncbi:hypothetical protein ACFYXS_13695 [Streptomyces sp. NPDC002574]|uniref:hypothetical protein n=1 Tax=Streptomyces sp. NPDC002574 TaxID=3364652 RepID=UPI0036A2AC5E
MDVRDYPTGRIAAEAAFTSDFDLPGDLSIGQIAGLAEGDRPAMDGRPGMHHKYLPLRRDEDLGVHEVGGRYLFDTWENAVAYVRFTDQLELEPGVTFWNRPFFTRLDRHTWRVVGAHDLTPLASTHHVSRLERWSGPGQEHAERVLEGAWTAVLEEAAGHGLAAVWLLHQPDERQIGLLRVRAADSTSDRAAVRDALAALEHLDAAEAGRAAGELGARKVFDRTSLNLALWLPLSRKAGGAASSHPFSELYAGPQPLQHAL